MKRLLSVLLSLSIMLTIPLNFVYSTNLDPYVKARLKGKSVNYFNVVNNKLEATSKAESRSSSKSKSNSKSSSTSNGGGGSGLGQLLKVGAVVGASAYGLKSLFGVSIFSLFGGAIAGWKAHNLKTTVDGYISSAKDGLKNFFYGNQTVPDQPTGQNGNQGNSESGTDQPTGQSGSKGDLESETDQPTGQNGGQDSQTSTEAEGGAGFNWENFSLTRALLGLDYYIRLASSKLGGPSIDQANPLYQTILI